MHGRIAIGLSMLMLCGPVSAETTRYQYDALGRLTFVDDRTGTSTGHTMTFNLDRAGNRSSTQIETARFSESFTPVNRLERGEEVLSRNALYRLTMQYDGNLVLYDQAGAALWSTGTFTGNFLIMQADGNLVLYDQNTQPVWNSQTSGHSGSFFAVQGDGNLVVYDTNGHAIWARFGL